jgi:hypothetical protein
MVGRKDMKKKGLIALYTLLSVFIVGIIATVVVIAVTNRNVNTDISMLYVAKDIEGTVSATYKVGDNEEKAMTDSEGNLVVSFDADQPSTVALLSPKEAITLNKGEDLVLTYTFTSTGEEYYARVSYSDADLPAENISITYENSLVGYDDQSSLVEVSKNGSITYSIKISVGNVARDASLEGTFDWTLTREEPKTLENSQLLMYYANNSGSSINADSFIYKTNSEGTKFKIVGAVPENIATTTTTGYVNGSYNTRTAMSDTSGDFLTVEELTNNNGAEFYYFCTNPAVVGSYSYNTPGTIYWTSTADDTLENWYDIPADTTTLYACFMTPNYTGRTLSKYINNIIVSNKVSTVGQTVNPNYYSRSVENAVIPQSVTSIGSGAFWSCKSLTNIIIPQSVTSIGYQVFYDCTRLTSIEVDENNKIYCSEGNCIIKRATNTLILGCKNSTIPDNVTNIGSYAFDGCTSLTSITIPNSVTSIGERAFSHCGLTEIEIPNSVISIGECAFEDCTGLASITIPSSVTSIGYRAFSGCTGLTSITIPDSITSVGDFAFSGCTNLKYNEYGNIKYLGNETNNYVVAMDTISTGITSCELSEQTRFIYNGAFYDCSSLASISIPNSVTSIGFQAFDKCTSLINITIPNSVTSISDYTFAYCSSLASISIPSSVTSIGDYAFYYCTGLKSITIPDSVTSIRWSAFDGCTNLTSVTFEDTTSTWRLGGSKLSAYSPTNPSTNATYLKSTYSNWYWTKNTK